MALFLMTVGGVVAQSSSGTEAVELGQNGIFVNQGTLDMKGNDIQDAGTTIWDASAGNIATAVVDYSAATAADVGLGNVRNVNLDQTAGDYLSYDGAFNTFNVNGSKISSETTASDVGLGSVQNEAQVAESGDTMTGELKVDNNLEIGDGYGLSFGLGPSSSSEVMTVEEVSFSTNDNNQDTYIKSGGDVIFEADNFNSGTDSYCRVDLNGDMECSGNKNWIHSLNSTHDAVYSSQESPQVRAVYEGSAMINGEETVELPSHFSKTVSDERPSLRAQVTPQGTFTKAVVMDKTDDNITIKVGEETEVNYRITGIREGYEDKDVVRPKEE